MSAFSDLYSTHQSPRDSSDILSLIYIGVPKLLDSCFHPAGGMCVCGYLMVHDMEAWVLYRIYLQGKVDPRSLTFGPIVEYLTGTYKVHLARLAKYCLPKCGALTRSFTQPYWAMGSVKVREASVKKNCVLS